MVETFSIPTLVGIITILGFILAGALSVRQKFRGETKYRHMGVIIFLVISLMFFLGGLVTKALGFDFINGRLY